MCKCLRLLSEIFAVLPKLGLALVLSYPDVLGTLGMARWCAPTTVCLAPLEGQALGSQTKSIAPYARGAV